MEKTTLILAVILMTITFISSQTKSKNPFGLVYRDAITENVPGKVSIHPVTYKLNGIDIAANVYTPAGYDASKKYAAVVVAHPNGGIKEQAADTVNKLGGDVTLVHLKGTHTFHFLT